jgi:hypothetical protein
LDEVFKVDAIAGYWVCNFCGEIVNLFEIGDSKFTEWGELIISVRIRSLFDTLATTESIFVAPLDVLR